MKNFIGILLSILSFSLAAENKPSFDMTTKWILQQLSDGQFQTYKSTRYSDLEYKHDVSFSECKITMSTQTRSLHRKTNNRCSRSQVKTCPLAYFSNHNKVQVTNYSRWLGLGHFGGEDDRRVSDSEITIFFEKDCTYELSKSCQHGSYQGTTPGMPVPLTYVSGEKATRLGNAFSRLAELSKSNSKCNYKPIPAEPF